MNVKVSDLMSDRVMTTTPSQTVGHVRKVMREHRVSCMPVVDGEGQPIGIVTATDLLAEYPDAKRVGQIISDQVYTVPQYADVSVAARTMRNHHIHHLVVTHDRRIVGLLSTYDLLRLVEDKRFTMKNPPSTPKRTRRRSGGRPETTI